MVTVNRMKMGWQGNLSAGEPVKLQYRLGIVGNVPTGTVVTNRAHFVWQGGEMEVDPVNVSVFLDADDHMIGPGGGQWQHAYGFTLQAPPNAVSETTRFQFRPLFTQDPPPDIPPGWQFAHRAFELTAFQFGELNQLNQPATISLNYSPQDIAGLSQNRLRLWHRNSTREQWAMLGEPHTFQDGQVSVQTDLLGEFILLGQSNHQLYLPILKK